MSWQDELQQLDSALASGQISADEYRIRRDRAIAQASGQSAAPDQHHVPAGEATQVVRPVSPPPPPPGERTQIVPPVGGADRTQVVGGHDNSSDNTQVVPGAQAAGHQPQFPPPPPPPPWETGHQQQPQQHQQQQQNLSAPPWGGEDSLPPEFGQQSWPTQGPEVFEESGSGNTGRVIAIVVAAILVLGLIGAGVWYFGFNKSGGGDDKEQAQTTKDKPTDKPTEEPKPDIPDGPFIELKGDLGGKIAYNRTRTRDEAIAASSPSKADVPIIQNNPTIESVSGLVTDDDQKNRAGIWAFKIAEGGDSAAVLQAIDQVYNQAGFQLTQENGLFIRTLTNTVDGVPYLTIRAHYVTKNGYVVRLESVGPTTEVVNSRFAELKSQMLDKYPPET